MSRSTLAQRIDAAQARLQRTARQDGELDGTVRNGEVRTADAQLRSEAAATQLSFLSFTRRRRARRLLTWAVLAAGSATLLTHRHGSQWDGLLPFVLVILLVVRIYFAFQDFRANRREQAARIAAALGSSPQYVSYRSGAPKWLAVLIYGGCTTVAVAVMIWHSAHHPFLPKSAYGFLTREMYVWILPVAGVVAQALWMAVAWRLRRRYPDRVLVFANEFGIGTADGWIIPYREIQRIDPGCSRSSFGADNWIQLRRKGRLLPEKMYINMALEKPDQILKRLRECAIAAGAQIAPPLMNGIPPRSGSQLGYKMEYYTYE